MGNRQKAEIVTYDIGMEALPRWQLYWGQIHRFLRMLHSISVQNRISAARPISKGHNF
jgi:hypothetical protein